MNSGMEDCTVLDTLLESDNWDRIMAATRSSENLGGRHFGIGPQNYIE